MVIFRDVVVLFNEGATDLKVGIVIQTLDTNQHKPNNTSKSIWTTKTNAISVARKVT